MRKISELNLNAINASASGLWQIKTAHKNLGCASVFITVFICHKPSAFAFIVYLKTDLDHENNNFNNSKTSPKRRPPGANKRGLSRQVVRYSQRSFCVNLIVCEQKKAVLGGRCSLFTVVA